MGESVLRDRRDPPRSQAHVRGSGSKGKLVKIPVLGCRPVPGGNPGTQVATQTNPKTSARAPGRVFFSS